MVTSYFGKAVGFNQSALSYRKQLKRTIVLSDKQATMLAVEAFLLPSSFNLPGAILSLEVCLPEGCRVR
jgi:hypothetical protein